MIRRKGYETDFGGRGSVQMTIEQMADDMLAVSGGTKMKAIDETLMHLADKLDAMHGEDSDWWKGYVAGIRRSAQLVEVHEAFRMNAETCGG